MLSLNSDVSMKISPNASHALTLIRHFHFIRVADFRIVFLEGRPIKRWRLPREKLVLGFQPAAE
jgi:hypothetical protein